MHNTSILLLLLALPAWAGNLYKVSVTTYVASSVADVVSSYGGLEVNPRMASVNGRLQTKGVLIKAAVTGSLVGVQVLATKIARGEKGKRRVRKICTLVNFVLTGVQTAITVRNARIDK